MSQTILSELEHNRKRLTYYSELKTRAGLTTASATKPAATTKKSAPQESAMDKWIEIYAERIRKLEKQATKLGLKTE